MAKAQTRIVLRGSCLAMGEELMAVTKSASLTELVGIMFSRYGQHLKQTWQVKAASQLEKEDLASTLGEPLYQAKSSSAPQIDFSEPIEL